MESNLLIYGLQSITAVLFAGFGFTLKGLFSRMDSNGKRINRLEVAMARNISENETLFKRLENIEAKLDRLLENRRIDAR
jgi:hypothetical protein